MHKLKNKLDHPEVFGNPVNTSFALARGAFAQSTAMIAIKQAQWKRANPFWKYDKNLAPYTFTTRRSMIFAMTSKDGCQSVPEYEGMERETRLCMSPPVMKDPEAFPACHASVDCQPAK
jgi:hypothetical protein